MTKKDLGINVVGCTLGLLFGLALGSVKAVLLIAFLSIARMVYSAVEDHI